MIRMDIVVLLNVLVNFLLLCGTNRLCVCTPSWVAMAFAAGISGAYAGLCLLPGFGFLGNTVWRLISIGLIAGLAFGFSKNSVRRCVVFALLSMALNGIAIGFGNGSASSQLAAALVVLLLCAVGFYNKTPGNGYIPVELQHNGKSVHLTALQDTGNGLRDPLTGSPVLVVNSDAARQLTGLTASQLQDPVYTLLSAGIPGLRIIPYKTVGNPCGMLLALRLQKVRVGDWEGSTLVAFAPAGLSREGAYQALTGGTL